MILHVAKFPLFLLLFMKIMQYYSSLNSFSKKDFLTCRVNIWRDEEYFEIIIGRLGKYYNCFSRHYGTPIQAEKICPVKFLTVKTSSNAKFLSAASH